MKNDEDILFLDKILEHILANLVSIIDTEES
jgi:hypothetical protein